MKFLMGLISLIKDLIKKIKFKNQFNLNYKN